MRNNNGKSMIFLVQWVIVLCFFVYLPLAQAQVGTVTLSAGNGFGEPGSTDNPVEVTLDNQDDRTTGLQFDLCRGDDLTLSACESTVRTTGISCTPNDLGNGCDRILFFSFGGDFIEAGTGPVLTLNYDVAPGAPQETCHDLTLANVIITECLDDGAGGCTSGQPYANVTALPGEFCFTCTTNTDCDDGAFCNGAETCEGIAGCRPGTNPCPGGTICDEVLDLCSVPFELLNPPNGSTLSSPPTFEWTTSSQYDAFQFYSIFEYNGRGPYTVKFWFLNTSFPMPANWWNMLAPGVPHIWTVIGVNTTTHDWEVADPRWFIKAP